MANATAGRRLAPLAAEACIEFCGEAAAEVGDAVESWMGDSEAEGGYEGGESEGGYSDEGGYEGGESEGGYTDDGYYGRSSPPERWWAPPRHRGGRRRRPGSGAAAHVRATCRRALRGGWGRRGGRMRAARDTARPPRCGLRSTVYMQGALPRRWLQRRRRGRNGTARSGRARVGRPFAPLVVPRLRTL